jgi:folylpolyglutamate synthase/dihydropteroate synthase
MLALIAKEAKSLFLAPLPDERAFSLQELRELAEEMPIHTEIFADIAEAFEALQRFLSPTEIGLITGSTRLAGEILALLETKAIG